MQDVSKVLYNYIPNVTVCRVLTKTFIRKLEGIQTIHLSPSSTTDSFRNTRHTGTFGTPL
jgi:hypothetical protein